MAEYRRFISYIYAYEGDMKTKNVGFAKIEARNGQCRMSISIKGAYECGGQALTLYGYGLRGDGFLLVPIGKLPVKNGVGEAVFGKKEDDLGGSGFGLDFIRGLFLRSGRTARKAYLTAWDDIELTISSLQKAPVAGESWQSGQRSELQAAEVAKRSGFETAGAGETNFDQEIHNTTKNGKERVGAEAKQVEKGQIEVEPIETKQAKMKQLETELNGTRRAEAEQLRTELNGMRQTEAEQFGDEAAETDQIELAQAESAQNGTAWPEKGWTETKIRSDSGTGETNSAPQMHRTTKNDMEEPGGATKTAELFQTEAAASAEAVIYGRPIGSDEQMVSGRSAEVGDTFEQPVDSPAEEGSVPVRRLQLPDEIRRLLEKMAEEEGDGPRLEVTPEFERKSSVRTGQADQGENSREMTGENITSGADVSRYSGIQKAVDQSGEDQDGHIPETAAPAGAAPEGAGLEKSAGAMPDQFYYREGFMELPLWDSLKRILPRKRAFVEEGWDILQIHLQDIGRLPRENWPYGNNSFVLHGYYQYRYLILARRPRAEREKYQSRYQYILGVPGIFKPQEKFMASMFGLPEFKRAAGKREEEFGFWCGSIHM